MPYIKAAAETRELPQEAIVYTLMLAQCVAIVTQHIFLLAGSGALLGRLKHSDPYQNRVTAPIRAHAFFPLNACQCFTAIQVWVLCTSTKK